MGIFDGLRRRSEIKALKERREIFALRQQVEVKSSDYAAQFSAFLLGDFAGQSLSDPVSPSLAYDMYDAAAPLAMVVDKIADAAASVFPVLTDGEQIIREHPVLDLIAEPGYGKTYEELARDYSIARLLTNNGFLNLVGAAKSAPASIQCVFPFSVTAERSERDGYAEAYTVNLNYGESITYRRETGWRFISNGIRELIHQKGATDDDGIMGRSPLSAIRLEIEQRIMGARHNRSFLEKGARPSGAMSIEGDMTADQTDRLVEQLGQRQQGYDNAGNLILLAGGKMNYAELSKSPRDLDYINLLNLTRDVIAQRYNVPLPLLSGDQMTLANMKVAQLSFWQDTVLPHLGSTFSAWSRALLPRFGLDPRKVFLTYDRSQIEALRMLNFETAKEMQGIGVFSHNELRGQAGYEPYDGGDAIYTPANLVPVGNDSLRDELPTKVLFDVFRAEVKKSEPSMTDEQIRKAWETASQNNI